MKKRDQPVICTRCGGTRYVVPPIPKAYVCKRCLDPKKSAPAAESPVVLKPRDPFYSDAARRKAVNTRKDPLPWIPPRKDWLR